MNKKIVGINELVAGNINVDFKYAGCTAENRQAWSKDYEVHQRGEIKNQLFKENRLNPTEQRSENHIALRDLEHAFQFKHHNKITQEQAQIEKFVQAVHNKDDVNHKGEAWQHVLVIGVGGSSLGNELVLEALKYQYKQHIGCSILDNIDPLELDYTLAQLELSHTLVIVISKTFTTLETMQVANRVKAAYFKEFKSKEQKEVIKKHFVAVTAQPERAKAFGMSAKHIFLFWEWVSGRFSVWSSVGLPIALVYGVEVWKELLEGAHEMDQAYHHQKCAESPIWTMAYLQDHYLKKYKAHAEAFVCYDARGKHLHSYLQQLYMESLGKNVSVDGELLHATNCPYVLGGVGTKDQHSYFQMIHQDEKVIPVHFISFKDKEERYLRSLQHHSITAQQLALKQGRKKEKNKSRFFSGNRPSVKITLEDFNAKNLGQFLAFWEHVVFSLSLIRNIPCFDQWGVELGKEKLKEMKG